MKIHWTWLTGLIGIALIFSACSSSNLKDTAEEGDAGPVELERVVELERETHFLSPSDEDVVVSPGIYSVEVVEGTLRLTPSGERGGSAGLGTGRTYHSR